MISCNPLLYMATAVSNILTDIIIFSLPTPIILKLKMGKSLKIATVILLPSSASAYYKSPARLTHPAQVSDID
jgi:hypothetical protein